MNTELDRLKKAFEAEGQSLPREDARKSTIAASMQAFEEENSTSRQGSADTDRLKNTGNTVFNFLFRRRSMTTIRSNLTPMLLGGASLAVLSIAILNTQQLKQTLPPVAEGPVAQLPADERKAGEAGAKQEEVFRQGEIVMNDADGNRVQRRKNDVGKGVIASNEAETSYAAPKRKEADIVARVDDLSGADNKSVSESQSQLEAIVSGGAMHAKRPATSQRGAKYNFMPSGEGDYLLRAAPKMFGKVASEQRAHRRIQKSADGPIVQHYQDQGRDRFSDITPNPVKLVQQEPVSTFSIDVDTASYAFMRASLNNNALPQKDAVRVEELINYFPYDYAPPSDKAEPFRTHVSVMPAPWNTHTKLVHIGIKGYELPKTDKPRSNLVFLLDTSGSMNAPNKLPLLRNSFKLLLSSLQPDDTIAIVTYAGSAGTVLEPTKVRNKTKIIAALDRLRSGGSTAGAEGIRQAYQLAEQNYDKDGVNRVILATDGDFNVGITDKEELKSYIERKRATGVSLSVLGFGMGNYNDELMQTLAQNGNGNASYIDSLSEARKVLVEEAGSTLFTIAKDVKIQIEFNPQTVSEYRLIGYETRLLNREDFNNDKIDAGDIGAGHSVTAIYEITPAGSQGRLVDDLRYQDKTASAPVDASSEYAFLKLRYKLPNSETSTLVSTAITRSMEVDGVASAPRDTRFATSVVAFGQLLRGGRFTGTYGYDDVIKLAQSAKGDDPFGYRAEFINLVRLAKSAAALEPLKQ